MKNERYLDFLKFALYRIIETAVLYETQAKLCKDSKTKLFLYFLAGKKRVQHVVLEMIAITDRGKPISLDDYNRKDKTPKEDICLYNSSSEEILNFAHGRAEKDLNLYISLAALEEDINTKKLLVTLSKLAKDFIQDVTAGYSKFPIKHIPKSNGPKIRMREKYQMSIAG